MRKPNLKQGLQLKNAGQQQNYLPTLGMKKKTKKAWKGLFKDFAMRNLKV